MKENEQTVLEQLYYGEVLSTDQIQSKDPNYAPTCQRISEEMGFLSSKLNPEEKKHLNDLVDLIVARDSMDAYVNFIIGFRYGALLMLDVLTGGDYSS